MSITAITAVINSTVFITICSKLFYQICLYSYVLTDTTNHPKKKKKINIKLKGKKTSWLSASDCHHTRILIAFIFLYHGRFICNIVLGVVIKHVSQVFKHHYWQVFWITSSQFGIADFLSFYFGWSFRSHWALLSL